MRRLLLTLALLGSVTSAMAAELAGVTMPDTADVAGETLLLNGMGLREKIIIDIYVGALYLPAKTTSAHKAIQNDEPKRLVMHFVYKEVGRDRLVEQYRQSMGQVSGNQAVGPELETLYGWMETMRKGDSVVFDYAPGEGTTVTVKGVRKGVIPGVDFMRVLFENYLGDNPPSAALKRGMLGS